MSRKKTLCLITALAAALVFCAAGSVSAGPLLEKALAYDEHYQAYHSPGLGGAVEVQFTDDSLTVAKRYTGIGDSTVHTGAYLAAEAFRYAATHDPEAKANALRAASALHHHLRITGKPGFIARYAGPAEPPFLASRESCLDKPRCHLVDGGTYGGHFWLGDTSRDQYDGWFFGNGIAYSLIDDPALRAMIRADVKEVIDALFATGWHIMDVDGLMTGAGSVAFNPAFQMGWEAVAMEAINEPKYRDRYRRDADALLPLVAASFLEIPGHHCSQYYAVMFFHRTAYNIARLDPSPTRRRLFALDFKELVRPFTRGADNVFFDYVYMAVAHDPDPAVIRRGREALALFPEPPNRRICREPPPERECALCALLSAMGRGEPSAVKPYPIEQQCSTDFLWQRSPYVMHCCARTDLAHVYPGIDFMLAYWMGRYHGFIDSND
ncbi:MAG TPA: hypothetical protein VM658_09980 [bacterium]|nr:hypothetical protein [bacterium]